MNVWQINHFKSKEKALEHIFKTLKDDQKTIVGRGVSDEHRINAGNYQLILNKYKQKGSDTK